MRILITRPAEDAAPLAARLHAMGLETRTVPLLTIHDLDGPPVDVSGVQALLATSANGVRAFARRSAERTVPVFAVGDATGRVAQEFGFTTVESAAGDVAALAQRVGARLTPGAGTLLHIAGSVLAGDLKDLVERQGFVYRRAVLYRAQTAQSLAPEIAAELRAGAFDAVVLYSPRTAQTFAELVRKANACEGLSDSVAYCLSAAVAEKIDAMTWGDIRIAARPEQDALLDLFAP
ncbi:uroporphyrinogen-III synthase [Varunaivibrio sulfuroxidans]|uniref:Uroporphyrinogen-III synthase n=1 Tax=Varunaivibrio sulfuroxidans TaxID=1773489 RepID=A0A4R3JHJ3_9PROT|nr:uroporphyrinogen-III synthase [Varunaivibrio sulfuroxidans]TCS64813.1 uroporphyrinogen-III synthase [Varunaivibrio sulfuroxidans]WES29886.1 uroporphyrinogen-III synthase [Varunaivibrio sulfuroxidans]